MLLKETALIRLLGLAKIPMLFFVGPQVMALDDDGCQVKIPLGYRTRNHWGTMYFGALAVGADLSGGLNALRAIRAGHGKVNLLFKDFQAAFLKRADGDVVFSCTQGREISDAVARADATGERVNLPVKIRATVPDKHGEQPVAEFTLTLSLKRS